MWQEMQTANRHQQNRMEVSQGKKYSHLIIEQLYSWLVRDKTTMHKDTRGPSLTAAQFKTARTEKQQKCSS